MAAGLGIDPDAQREVRFLTEILDDFRRFVDEILDGILGTGRQGARPAVTMCG